MVVLSLNLYMNKASQMTPYLSDKLKVLSLFSIVLVIYIHMFYTEGIGMPIFEFVSTFLGGSICAVAVPLFYIISGYLFFLKAKSLVSIKDKMKKRVRTLLIPYLLANTLTFIFYVALNLLSRMNAALNSVVNFKVLDTFNHGFLLVLSDIYWGPIAFQLWFVRDLMIIVLFSPLIYLLLKYLSNTKLGMLMLLIGEIFIFYMGISSLFWFLLGGIFAFSVCLKCERIYRIKVIGCILGIAYITLCLLNAFKILPLPIVLVIPLLGVPAIWIIYDQIVRNRILCNSKKMASICSYTFFIYLVHEPLLNIFKKIPLLVSRSELMITFCYLLIPPLFIIVIWRCGVYLKRNCKCLYNVYTGGR